MVDRGEARQIRSDLGEQDLRGGQADARDARQIGAKQPGQVRLQIKGRLGRLGLGARAGCGIVDAGGTRRQLVGRR